MYDFFMTINLLNEVYSKWSYLFFNGVLKSAHNIFNLIYITMELIYRFTMKLIGAKYYIFSIKKISLSQYKFIIWSSKYW